MRDDSAMLPHFDNPSAGSTSTHNQRSFGANQEPSGALIPTEAESRSKDMSNQANATSPGQVAQGDGSSDRIIGWYGEVVCRPARKTRNTELGPGLASTHYGNAGPDPNYLKFLLFQIVAAQIHCL
jgi:hypothetical protein